MELILEEEVAPPTWGAIQGPNVCKWSSCEGLWLFMSPQPKITAGWHLTCSRAVPSAEEGALGPLRLCLYPGALRGKGVRAWNPKLL